MPSRHRHTPRVEGHGDQVVERVGGCRSNGGQVRPGWERGKVGSRGDWLVHLLIPQEELHGTNLSLFQLSLRINHCLSRLWMSRLDRGVWRYLRWFPDRRRSRRRRGSRSWSMGRLNDGPFLVNRYFFPGLTQPHSERGSALLAYAVWISAHGSECGCGQFLPAD